MKISFSKLCQYFYNGKKVWKDIRVFTQFCCNVAHSGNFSSFNPAIVSFSLSSISVGLSTLCNCSVIFQLWRLKWTLISKYDKREYYENAFRKTDAVCYYKEAHAQFQSISLCIVRGSRNMFKVLLKITKMCWNLN